MKKRIYFIISSIIGIIWSIVTIINLNVKELIKEQIEFFNDFFSNNIPENLLQTINNPTQYYVCIIIAIILFLAILVIAIKDKITIKKTTLIILSILLLLFANDAGLIGIINIFVLLTIKKEIKNDKKKEENLKLKDPKREKWDKIEGILIILSYFIMMIILPFILRIFIKSPSENTIVILNLIFDITLLIITLTIFYDELKYQIKNFIQKIKPYFKVIFESYLLLFGLNILGSIIIILVKGDLVQSANQTAITELPILYLIFGTIIFAPIVEELVFRGSIRRLIKNDTLFMIISAIVFGLLHTVGQEDNLFNTILMALPYAGMGFALARTYVKTNNLCCNITLHAMQNLFSTIIIIINFL